MGSKISIDKYVSRLEDILALSPKNLERVHLESKIPDQITQNIKIWRFHEEESTSKRILSSPISLQNLQNQNFSFLSTECYVVLVVYRQTNEDAGDKSNNSFVSFPHSMWGIVESYNNLTPRGLENPLSRSELNLEILDSFLLPSYKKKERNSQNFEHMIFVWNGKNSNPLIKSLALSSAYSLESQIEKGGDNLLQIFFSGGVILRDKLKNGKVIQLNSTSNQSHQDKDLEKEMSRISQTIFLFKFLFPLNSQRHPPTVITQNQPYQDPNQYQQLQQPQSEQSSMKDYNQQNFSGNQHLTTFGAIEQQQHGTCTISGFGFEENPINSWDSQNNLNKYNQNQQQVFHSQSSFDSNTTAESETPFMKHFRKAFCEEKTPKANNFYANFIKIPAPKQSIQPPNTNASKIPQITPTQQIAPLYAAKIDNYTLSPQIQSKPNKINVAQKTEQQQQLPRMNQFAQPQQKFCPGILKINTNALVPENRLNFNAGSTHEEPPNPIQNIKKAQKICSEVLPQFMYVSGQDVAYNKDILKKNGITHIINCARDVCMNKFPNEFTYKEYRLKDSKKENIECVFYDSIQFIEEALQNNGRVYIHCAQGVSRSISISIAYIIWKEKIDFQTALELVKKAREVASPNQGFIVQLINFYCRLYQPYESITIKPRVWCVSTHQIEKPSSIVAKMLLQGLYPLQMLDPRGLFIIQSTDSLYIWIGNAIPQDRKIAYQEYALKYLDNLRRFEGAVEGVQIYEQGNEAAEFWDLWFDEKPEICYQENSEWNNWFIDITDDPNFKEGPDFDDGEEERDDNDDIGDYANNLNENGTQQQQRKPQTLFFVYPDACTRFAIFDYDDLDDESMCILCRLNGDIVKIHIWKGYEFREPEETEQKFLGEVISSNFPEHDLNKIYIQNEIPNQESDEFNDCFSSN